MNTDILPLLVQSSPLFIQGLVSTICLFFSATILSIFLGVIFGVLSADRLRYNYLSSCINTLTFSLRAIPFYVQLLLIYFVVPDLFGINLAPFDASVLALGLCSSGYVSQFIRAGINSVPPTQWEAAFTLGYTRVQTLQKVIFPQAMQVALPSLNNELESLLKSTAIASSIGMLELTRIGMNIVSREMEPIPIYISIAVLYALLSILLNALFKQIERRYSYVSC